MSGKESLQEWDNEYAENADISLVFCLHYIWLAGLVSGLVWPAWQ